MLPNLSECCVSALSFILKNLIDWKRHKKDFYLNVNVLICVDRDVKLPGVTKVLRHFRKTDLFHEETNE